MQSAAALPDFQKTYMLDKLQLLQDELDAAETKLQQTLNTPAESKARQRLEGIRIVLDQLITSFPHWHPDVDLSAYTGMSIRPRWKREEIDLFANDQRMTCADVFVYPPGELGDGDPGGWMILGSFFDGGFEMPDDRSRCSIRIADREAVAELASFTPKEFHVQCRFVGVGAFPFTDLEWRTLCVQKIQRLNMEPPDPRVGDLHNRILESGWVKTRVLTVDGHEVIARKDGQTVRAFGYNLYVANYRLAAKLFPGFFPVMGYDL